MKIYRVDFYDTSQGALVRWAPNAREAHVMLHKLQRERGEPTAGPEGVEAVEIPTDKSGLIRWLNDNFTSDNG